MCLWALGLLEPKITRFWAPDMGAENWEQQTLLTTGWAISLALLLISVLVFEINSWSSCLSLPHTVWQMWVTKPCWNTLFSPQPLRVPCLFSGTAQFHQNTYSLTISTMKDSSFKTDNLHAPLLTQCPEPAHSFTLGFRLRGWLRVWNPRVWKEEATAPGVQG